MATNRTETQHEAMETYIDSVSHRIEDFLTSEIARWNAIDNSITPPLNALMQFFNSGGKRLRPAFCYLGFVAESGDMASQEINNAGCALELLHNFALVHDDFMDRADTRRGKPTVHKLLYSYYSNLDYVGDLEQFANSVAILAGDFAFTYADRFARDLPKRCLDIYDELKIELFAGQQMDLDAVYKKSISKNDISLIAQYKSGKYTIERPLALGAVLANEHARIDLWSAFGKPLGEAFQLRDDVLGIFGDENVTGKPVGGDIREGKFTLLVAEAIERTSGREREIIDRRGDADLSDEQVAEIVAAIDECGARLAVEERIEALFNESISALDQFNFDESTVAFAVYLARYVCWRES